MAATKRPKKFKQSNQGSNTVKNTQATKTQDKRSILKNPGAKPAQPFLVGRWQQNLIVFLLLAFATVMLYSGDLHLGFFGVDDPDYVVNNPWIKGWSSENLHHILSNPYFANYSPLHLLSYMIDYSMNGADPYVFHLSSNIWAGIVAGFVFLTALALTKNQLASIIAALLFVVHPAHVEAIAWISSRKDLVAAAFALPSLLCYLRYRHDASSKRWYVLSILFFGLAVAGKLSVATFPAVYYAIDVLIEKRPWIRSLINKIPFLIIALIIAGVAAGAQPAMGNKPDVFIITAALLQNIWLLTGFGDYVIFRITPETTQVVLKILAFIFLLALYTAPLLIRNRWPKIAVLVYWILFAFIPTQVLSFTHPVTDRYLFFPSVAATILIGLGIVKATALLKKQEVIMAAFVTLILAAFWTRASLAYLAEWKDPRSVWYASTQKSSDPNVYQNLGSYYLGTIDEMNAEKNVSFKTKYLAEIVWKDDPRLSTLLSKWDKGQKNSAEEKALQDQLRSMALAAFDHSIANKGNRIMPAAYYNRALIFLNKNELPKARQAFIETLHEAAKEPFADVREQLTVYCHFDLGVIAWKQNNYPEALQWFKMAEEEQIRFGKTWLPGAAQNRKQLEQMLAASKKL